MKKLLFSIERSVIGNVSSTVWLYGNEDISEELRATIWETIRLDVHVTIGGVTMPATMWEDPEHWAEDWMEELNVSYEDAPDAVANILAGAISDYE
jgi:hypothetical protein